MKLLSLMRFLIFPVMNIFAYSSQAEDLKCKAQVIANTRMQYSTNVITIPMQCKSFKITLKYDGKLQKNIMGHNLVISQAEDMDVIVKQAITAGIKGEYIPTDRSQVIAATRLLSGGEEDTITIDTKVFKAQKNYTFYCTFPGHSGLMKGKIQLMQ